MRIAGNITVLAEGLELIRLMWRDYLVLHQRNSALNRVAGEDTIVALPIGDKIPLPNTRTPIMVAITMKLTIICKLLNFFYRPPFSQLPVAYENGAVERYRLTSAMATKASSFVRWSARLITNYLSLQDTLMTWN
ncbi:hypothetical protein D3C80_249300 [compost metagenome]